MLALFWDGYPGTVVFAEVVGTGGIEVVWETRCAGNYWGEHKIGF